MSVPLMSSAVTSWFVWVRGDVCWPAAHLTRLTGTPGNSVQCRGTWASDLVYKEVSPEGPEFSTCSWMFLRFAAHFIFQYWCYEDFSTINEISLSCCLGEGSINSVVISLCWFLSTPTWNEMTVSTEILSVCHMVLTDLICLCNESYK